jgi:hypothetical protein
MLTDCKSNDNRQPAANAWLAQRTLERGCPGDGTSGDETALGISRGGAPAHQDVVLPPCSRPGSNTVLQSAHQPRLGTWRVRTST